MLAGKTTDTNPLFGQVNWASVGVTSSYRDHMTLAKLIVLPGIEEDFHMGLEERHLVCKDGGEVGVAEETGKRDSDLGGD